MMINGNDDTFLNRWCPDKENGYEGSMNGSLSNPSLDILGKLKFVNAGEMLCASLDMIPMTGQASTD